MRTCGEFGGVNKQGNPCGNPAGARTSHKGEGKCYKHGGASNGAPLKHGRYAYSIHGKLGDKIRKHMENPNPLDLSPELALLRARIEFLTDEISKTDAKPTPSETSMMLLLVQGIQKVADTISKIQTREVLTAREVEYLLHTLVDILKGWDGKTFNADACALELQCRCQLPGLTAIEVVIST